MRPARQPGTEGPAAAGYDELCKMRAFRQQPNGLSAAGRSYRLNGRRAEDDDL